MGYLSLECDLGHSVPHEMVHYFGHVTWGSNCILVVGVIKPFEFLCFCSVVELSSLGCDAVSLVNQFQTFKDMLPCFKTSGLITRDAETH